MMKERPVHNAPNKPLPDDVLTRPAATGDAGKYVGGDDGHVYCYSTARVNARKPYPFRLSETVCSRGYPFVSMSFGRARRSVRVHQVVCRAFHGTPSVGQCVRHLDGDRLNNVPINLAWGTHSENEADKRRHGRVACGERHGNASLTDEAVRIIRASIPVGLWNVRDAALVFGVDTSTIRRIARGERWRHV